MIQELEQKFTGIGEVKGFEFNRVVTSKFGMIYKVSDEGKEHYEVFERKLTALCIDFEKKIYSNEDYKVRYPKAKDFGVWAFSVLDLKTAISKLDIIDHLCYEKSLNDNTENEL